MKTNVIGLLAIMVMVASCAGISGTRDGPAEGVIMTVQGPISPAKLGWTLPHEHLVGSFTNLDQSGPLNYSPDAVIDTMLPLLNALEANGFTGVIEPSTIDLARDVSVLKELSNRSGVHIVTNTGNYGAFGDAFTLEYALTETADQLAERWVREWEDGIDGTSIRPGFIKIGVDPGALSDLDKKLVKAAARAHLKTGLTIYCHTGESEAALEALEIVVSEGVHPSALVVVHSTEIGDLEALSRIAESGAWLSFDHVGNFFSTLSLEEHAELIKIMLERGYLNQILVSSDSGWYNVADPKGWTEFAGNMFHPSEPTNQLGIQYDVLIIPEIFLDVLRNAGFDDKQIEQIFITNPAKALTVKIRT